MAPSPSGGRRGAALSLLALMLTLGGCGGQDIVVDGARAQERVKHQVDAGPRIPGTPGHAAIQRWIESELERLGARVERQSFIDTSLGRPLALTNLIGHYGPRTGRRVALCAHWDTRYISDQDPDSTHRHDPVPGANDAGSGVAVLLEVAELLHRKLAPIAVDLVFFDGEDQGAPSNSELYCLGSREYARRLEPGSVTAAFLFDMVGDRELQIHPEQNSTRRASNLVAIVNQAAHATGATHFHDDPRWELYDDHVRLLEAGVPAVDIIDFDYPAWHTHQDLPDRTSPESLAEVSRVAAWIVYRSPIAQL